MLAPRPQATLSAPSAFSSIASFKIKRQILFIHTLLLAIITMAHSTSHDHCYTDLGCFPLSREFYHPRHRPFNVRPWHRQHIKTQFELFNQYHPEGYMMLPWDKSNLETSHFDPMLETKVIIPGWLDNINRAIWVKKLRDALLWAWAPVNIIIVRWRNFTPYTIATANTRVVGAELANFMKFLEHDLQYDRAYYHIIGHSLGAHIGGYTGDRMPGLGRITALDPARPFFQGMPKSVRLDRGDAKFIDVIHSDFTPENAIFLIMSYGMTIPIGHLDFYPNGPPLFQPGCLRDTLNSVQDGIAKGLHHNSLSVAFLEATRYLTACDHQRSHEWFIESITNRECLFVGVRCNEFEGMINGRCTCDDSRSACAIMGIHADQMYLHGVHEDVWPIRADNAIASAQRPGNYHNHYEPIHSPYTQHAQIPRPLPIVPAIVDEKHQHPSYNQKRIRQVWPLDTSLPMEHPQRPQFSNDGLTAAQQLSLLVPPLPSEYSSSSDQSAVDQLNQYIAAAALLDTHTGVPIAPAFSPSSTLDSSKETTSEEDIGQKSPIEPTRDQIYSQLKQQLELMSQRPEPLIHGLTKAELETSASNGQQNTTMSNSTVEATKNPVNSTEILTTTTTMHSANQTDSDSDKQHSGDKDYDEGGNRQEDLEAAGSEMFGQYTPENYPELDEQQMVAAMQDAAFMQFLRASLLLNSAADSLAQKLENNTISKRYSQETSDTAAPDRRPETFGHPAQYNGHPQLMSSMHRDTENWYESTSRWFLKTNNRPNYCSNQYQLLVFLGPLSTITARDRLRANLIISLIGSRGQLLNQRFIPRGATLNSFTMQPFFILLEGSYSLGQVHSVAIAWEARRDPDPIKATVTFQSSPALEAIQSKVPAYKAKNNPWLPNTSSFDKSDGFEWTRDVHGINWKQPMLNRLRRAATAPTTDHQLPSYDAQVPKIQPNIIKILAETSQQQQQQIRVERKFPNVRSDKLERRMSALDYVEMMAQASSSHQQSSPAQNEHEADATGQSDYDDSNSDDYDSGEQSIAKDSDKNSQQAASTVTQKVQEPVDVNYRDPSSKYMQKHYIADDDGGSMFEPLHHPVPFDQLVPANQLTLEDALDNLDPKTLFHLHNVNFVTQDTAVHEDTIVINQIIVSPIQATYGRYGRQARTFCPPGTGGGQRLGKEQTIKLSPSLLGRCHFGHHHQSLVT